MSRRQPDVEKAVESKLESDQFRLSCPPMRARSLRMRMDYEKLRPDRSCTTTSPTSPGPCTAQPSAPDVLDRGHACANVQKAAAGKERFPWIECQGLGRRQLMQEGSAPSSTAKRKSRSKPELKTRYSRQ